MDRRTADGVSSVVFMVFGMVITFVGSVGVMPTDQAILLMLFLIAVIHLV